MTTVACDGITVAADGLAVAGNTITSRSAKKLRVLNNRIYAMTGDVAVFEALIAWFEAGADPAKVPTIKEPQWGFHVFYPEHAARYISDCPYPDIFPYPCAFGSGAQFADMAMALGLNAADAIAATAKLDVYTGGEIRKIMLADVYAEKRMAAE